MSILKVNSIIPFSTNEITMVSASLSGSITNATSASYAQTATSASYALRAEEGGFPFTGSAEISGSLIVSDEFIIPIGTTSDRPSNPSIGSLRFNITDGENGLEIYNGDRWFSFGGGFAQLDIETIQTTTTVNNADAENLLPPLEVDYLIVAGGGSGGNNKDGSYENGGGGGAGGLLSGTETLATGSTYNITIGAGGSIPAANGQTQGSNSSALGFTSTGGGGGSTRDDQSNINGGSGGGAVNWNPNTTNGTGIAGQGNAGGVAGETSSGDGGSAGGGGSAEVGGNGSGTVGGNGGSGTSSSITGTPVFYAGGGGGGGGTAGTGGVGGGGDAGNPSNKNGTNGSANTIVVVDVSPLPTEIVYGEGKLRITIPEPPLPALPSEA
jgi:hypothetical protein